MNNTNFIQGSIVCIVLLAEHVGPFVAVSGADVVDWLYSRVEGFKDRRDARKYASSLLKHGYLRHTVNKITFSEQCYYTFGDLCQSTAPRCPSVSPRETSCVRFIH